MELCYEFTPLPPNARVSRARSTEGTAGALPIQTGPPLDPAAGQKVLRALRPFPGSQEGRQEDAEEFLGCLLNGLNDEMLEVGFAALYTQGSYKNELEIRIISTSTST